MLLVARAASSRSRYLKLKAVLLRRIHERMAAEKSFRWKSNGQGWEANGQSPLVSSALAEWEHLPDGEKVEFGRSPTSILVPTCSMFVDVRSSAKMAYVSWGREGNSRLSNGHESRMWRSISAIMEGILAADSCKTTGKLEAAKAHAIKAGAKIHKRQPAKMLAMMSKEYDTLRPDAIIPWEDYSAF